MSNIKSTPWGKFTLELTRVPMYESDIKNYEIIIEYADLIGVSSEKFKCNLIKLKDRIDYLYSLLDYLYWKDKELLIRCYIKKYSNKMAGRIFGMDGKAVNGRITKVIKKRLLPIINIENLEVIE